MDEWVARSTASELGFQVNQAVVLHNSDRIAVRIIPCDVLARIAPQAWEDAMGYEAEVARRLAETDSPIGELAPNAEPRVYLRDTFALTLWTYYEQMGDIMPADDVLAPMGPVPQPGLLENRGPQPAPSRTGSRLTGVGAKIGSRLSKLQTVPNVEVHRSATPVFDCDDPTSNARACGEATE